MILITGHKGFIGSKLYKKIRGRGLDKKDGNNLLTMQSFPKADIIYHLAANTSVEESLYNPEVYMLDIVALARISKQYPNAKIIFAQSAASINPQSPYGFSKLACGEYLKRFHKDYVICTFPNVYGGGKGVIDIFKDQDTVTIYGDGEQVRDFVHVDDIIEGLVLAKDWTCGEYSMGSGKGTKIIDLAKDKTIRFAPARQEIRESILPNTTPNG